MKNKTAYLKCKIGQGIFKEENSVVFKNISGNKISGIFPESSIKNKRLSIQNSKRLEGFFLCKALLWNRG